MRPLLHPFLVNGRFGDPVLYVETLFEKQALLFDLGDISALPPRKIHSLEHVFVSHIHADHFIGFDHLLRLLVGREKTVRLYGPPGFIERVHHKLQAYQWNLVDRYPCDLALIVAEIDAPHKMRRACFRLKRGFAGEALGCEPLVDGAIHREPTYRVTAAMLEHRAPCLGFAIEETAHVNIWKNRLKERGLPVGPWLRELKRAVMENRPDDTIIRVEERSPGTHQALPLGTLRDVLTISPGQKIGYVTDVADTPELSKATVQLAHGADLLFIEAAFAAVDASLAAERGHLTTTAAGRLARAANVRRVEPFHFSPRYTEHESNMLSEVMAAFSGADAVHGKSG